MNDISIVINPYKKIKFILLILAGASIYILTINIVIKIALFISLIAVAKFYLFNSRKITLTLKRAGWFYECNNESIEVHCQPSSVIYPGFVCLKLKEAYENKYYHLFFLKFAYNEQLWYTLKRQIMLNKYEKNM